MIIDFKEIEISAPAILLIFPGQVHQVVAFDQPAAISINFDPSLVVADMKSVLEQNFKANVYLNGGDVLYRQLLTWADCCMKRRQDRPGICRLHRTGDIAKYSGDSGRD